MEWLRRLTVVNPRCALAVALAFVITGCASSPIRATTSRLQVARQADAASTKTISFNGVQVSIPASWPVLDGAHRRYLCSETFLEQADRAFLGSTYWGAPSCGATAPHSTPPPADGVWLKPSGPSPPQPDAIALPGRQGVFLLPDPVASSVIDAWSHRVLIQIGIGANPAVARAILDSVTYTPTAANSAVLGRCPPPDPTPPTMPAPTRLTAPLGLGDGNSRLQPEPPNIQPKASAAVAWTNLFHDFWAGGFQGALQWSIVFGSYAAPTPAQINPDGSITPLYQDVPTWLIRGVGVQTGYGACGMTVLAPYNADTGAAMGVTTIG